MSQELYVIEAREPDGTLKFDCEQPEKVFGDAAIKGIGMREMAEAIFARVSNVTLTGDAIPLWPRVLNPHWTARRKTW